MATGYGKDTSCTDSLHVGRLVSGKELVAQAMYRRLITPRGSLSFTDVHLTYGLDLTDYVGLVGYEQAVRSLPAQVKNELEKDDRVALVEVETPVLVGTGAERELLVKIHVYLEDGQGDFELTLSVSQARTLLVGVEL